MSQLRLQLDEDMKKASADPSTLGVSKRGDFVDYSNSHWLIAATDDERTGTKVHKKKIGGLKLLAHEALSY
jgi:hypothetical protein